MRFTALCILACFTAFLAFDDEGKPEGKKPVDKATVVACAGLIAFAMPERESKKEK